MENSISLEKDSIGKLLFKFSIPAVVGMLVNALYGAVDTMFVGKFVGTNALAGVGVTFPITNTIMAVGMLVGIGAAARISLSLGQRKKRRAEKYLGNAVVLMIIGYALVGIMGKLMITGILSYLELNPEVVSYANTFTNIMLIGSVFQIVGLGLNNVIRSCGSPKVAMFTMIIGGVTNIILDYIFIVPFKMGVAGAAWATIIAQAVSCIWVTAYFFGKNSLLKMRLKNFKLSLYIVWSIVSIGFAPFMLQMAGSLIQFILSKQIVYAYSAGESDLVIGVMAVISRVTMILLMPVFGVNQGAQPIIGFNYGAKQYDRVKKTLKLAMIVSTTLCVLSFIMIETMPEVLLKLFISKNDTKAIEIGTHAIRIYCLGFAIIGFQVISSSFFQSIGKAAISMVLSMSRQIILLIPFLLILPRFLGSEGIWISAPMSDFLAFILSVTMIRWEMKKIRKMELSA